MDQATIDAYDVAASEYARDWQRQPSPSDLRDLLRRHLTKGQTADIGCGSGREVAWLNANSFPTVGYEGSTGFLEVARRCHPALEFRFATLPQLEGINSNAFENVLCETVIMHLPFHEIATSVQRLLDITKLGGMLYLSWRVTKEADVRDKKGRLYTAFSSDIVRNELLATATLLDSESMSESSGKIIHRILVRK